MWKGLTGNAQGTTQSIALAPVVPLAEGEKQMILSAMSKLSGNASLACSALGISRSNFVPQTQDLRRRAGVFVRRNRTARHLGKEDHRGSALSCQGPEKASRSIAAHFTEDFIPETGDLPISELT